MASRRCSRSASGGCPDSCRSVLGAAAVLGREFSFDVLRATVGADEDELIAALEEARDAQLIVELDRGDAPAYGFTHALVRQTLYAGTSAPRRRRLHAQAAAALERAPGEDQIAALARHHRLAGSAGDPAKAIECSLAAGRQAAARFAWDDAAEHWDGAVAVMARAGGRERERADLLVALGDLMVVVGDLGRQIAYLEQALALYDAARRRRARGAGALAPRHGACADGFDLRRPPRHLRARSATSTPRGRCSSTGPPRRARGHLEVGVATALTYGLRIEPGLDAARRAMEIADAVGDEVLWSGAAEAYGWHALVAGRLGRGLRDARAGLRRRRPPPAAVPGVHGREHPRPVHLGHRRARRGAGPLRASAAAPVRGRRRVPAADRRRDRALPRRARGDRRGARHLPDATADLDHPLAAAGPRPLGRRPRGGRRAGRADARDQPADRQPLGRVGLASARGTRLRPARRAGTRPSSSRRGRCAIVVDGGAPYFELWVRPDLARALAEVGSRRGGARARRPLRARSSAGGEDWRGRAGIDRDRRGRGARRTRAARRTPNASSPRARAVLGRHGLRGEEAELLHQWGRLLAAPERLDEAAELYRRHGAGRLWLDRVAADRSILA